MYVTRVIPADVAFLLICVKLSAHKNHSYLCVSISLNKKERIYEIERESTVSPCRAHLIMCAPYLMLGQLGARLITFCETYQRVQVSPMWLLFIHSLH